MLATYKIFPSVLLVVKKWVCLLFLHCFIMYKTLTKCKNLKHGGLQVLLHLIPILAIIKINLLYTAVGWNDKKGKRTHFSFEYTLVWTASSPIIEQSWAD